MKTIEINLYKLAELSDEAREKAINRLSEINVDYDWWDITYEDAEQIGLKITGFDLDHKTIEANDYDFTETGEIY